MEEWEEPLHPGSLRANISHFLPQCNPICTFSPTAPPRDRRSAEIPSPAPGCRPEAPPRRRPAPAQARVQRARAARVLAGWSLRRGPPRHIRSLRLEKGKPAASRRPLRPCYSPSPRSCVAGCGSSSHPDGTEADPATAVPATAPLYVGADRAPHRLASRAARWPPARRSPDRQDPYERLLGALRTPGLAAARLQARRGALAGTARGPVRALARLRGRAARAADDQPLVLRADRGPAVLCAAASTARS